VLLDDLAVGEVAAQGLDPAADMVVPFVDGRRLPPPRPQATGAAQAGDAATDDRDPRLWGRTGALRHGQAAGGREDAKGGTGLEDRTPAQAVLGGQRTGSLRSFGPHRRHLVDGYPRRSRFGRGSVRHADHGRQQSVQRGPW